METETLANVEKNRRHPMNNFTKVKSMVTDLGLTISEEQPSEELLVVQDDSRGVNNLIVDCEESILVIEQYLGTLRGGTDPSNGLARLLQLNRQLVHGAFALDDSGQKVLFRDTLALENLDLNELEGSINALTLGLSEFGSQLIEIMD